MELVSLGCSLWALGTAVVLFVGALRFRRQASGLLADARVTLDEARRVHAEVERLNSQSTRLHDDAVRLLAEADQLAADARED